MAIRRYMAIHPFHSEKTKEAMWAMASEDKSSQKDWAKAQSFDKCRCLATWSRDDDFFFCHWVAETEEDIHNALSENQLDEFVFTACYEAQKYIDTACLSDEGAFPTRETVEA